VAECVERLLGPGVVFEYDVAVRRYTVRDQDFKLFGFDPYTDVRLNEDEK
jgi:hypothetical protein